MSENIAELIAEAEALPVFDLPELTNDDAVELGLIAVDLIRAEGLNLAVRIVLRDDVVFQAKLKQTGPGNDEWLAGKAAAATLSGEPSLLSRLRAEAAGTTFAELPDIDHAVVKGFGGSIPLRVAGELVGTITTSGEADTTDHRIASEAVRRFLAAR